MDSTHDPHERRHTTYTQPHAGAGVAHTEIDRKHWNLKRELGFVDRWLSAAQSHGLDLAEVLSRSSTGPDRGKRDLAHGLDAGAAFRSCVMF